MASGRMEFHARSIMQHANFTFVLPNDVEMEEVFDKKLNVRETEKLVKNLGKPDKQKKKSVLKNENFF